MTEQEPPPPAFILKTDKGKCDLCGAKDVERWACTCGRCGKAYCAKCFKESV